ncbi:MAG: hypothetical protein ACE5GM_03450 [bacterium]
MGYINDERVGHLAPNQVAAWNNSCYRINPVKTNSFGFRDIEWDNDSSYKIAVLGDSYTEALQTGEGEYASRVLEKIKGRHEYIRIACFS